MEEKSNGITEANLPKLQFPFMPLMNGSTKDTSSPERPIQTRASIPFRWEEKPGKPRPCPEIISRPEPARLSLELPPCRKHHDDKITKTPSPTAVLDGPYKVSRSKFSSLRLFVRECVHDTVLESSGSSESPTEGIMGKNKVRSVLGKLQRGASRKEGLGSKGSFGFSPRSRFSPGSFESDRESTAKVKRDGSFSEGLSPSHGYINSTSSHLMGSIYKGLKQAIPWNMSSKSSNETTNV